MNAWSPSWAPDSETIYYVSNHGGSMDLWQQRLRPDGAAEGPAARVTSGVGIRHATLSRDGAKLAYSKGRSVANVWRVPILDDRRATWSDAEQLTFDQALFELLDVSGDGEQLLMSSDRGGNLDVWVMPSAGGELRQLTTDPGSDWAPALSPDGSSVLLYSTRSGNRDVWSIPLAGGTPRNLTRTEFGEWVPSWYPDGSRIAYHANPRSNLDIWTMAADGSDRVQITSHASDDEHARYSHDGKWIVFASLRGGESRLWRVPAEGGEPELLTEARAHYFRWSEDGGELLYPGLLERAGNIRSYAMSNGTERPVTDFEGRPGNLGGHGLATDGAYLYFTWEQDLGDLWVMSVKRP